MGATEDLSLKGESFAELFEASMAEGDLGREGEIVTGTVVQIGRDSVVVDIGGKSEGVIPIAEFNDGGEVGVKVGDKVDVFIESRETDDGLVSLSKEKADKMKVWDEISGACERDELISRQRKDCSGIAGDSCANRVDETPKSILGCQRGREVDSDRQQRLQAIHGY